MAEKERAGRLPDPQGAIARVRSRMSSNCAVRLSPYCDVLISMRMQGVNFREMEKWLTNQGLQFRISATTLWRNMKKAASAVELPYFEELAEKWGGRLDMDAVRELAGQIVAQRRRIDRLQRHEEAEQQLNPKYHDRRIRAERELFTEMAMAFHNMTKEAPELETELEKAMREVDSSKIQVSPDGMTMIRELLLSGDVRLGGGVDDGSSLH